LAEMARQNSALKVDFSGSYYYVTRVPTFLINRKTCNKS